MIALGCKEKKIIIHRMGIDTSKFRYFPCKLIGNENIRILTVARLVEKKGVQYGIQAFAKVLKKYSNIEYKIVGDGPLKEDLESMIKRLGIGEKVKLLGRMAQEEVIEIMKDATILLAHSVTGDNGDQEGIPVVLMEALALGLPVISTYHSGIPELVKDGKSGFLVPEKDIDSLAEKLMYLIKDPKIRIKISQEGRKYVKENHDINDLNDQLLEVYQQVLNEEFLCHN